MYSLDVVLYSTILVPEGIPVPVISCPTQKEVPTLVEGAEETKDSVLPVKLHAIVAFRYPPEVETYTESLGV